jgi:hypothetical protein
MEAAFIAALLEASEQGQRADNSWKKQAWEQAKKDVQAVAGSSNVTLASLKNKLDSWKKDWRVWEQLSRQSGFSVVDGVVVGDPVALESYFATHPEASKFKNRPLKFADELAQLFAGTLATGGDVMTVEDIISQTIESSPTPSRSVSCAVSEASSSKRSATSSGASSTRKRLAPADRVGRQIGGLADQLTDLISVMRTDYQRDAIQVIEEEYEVLHAALRFAVIEVFSEEFKAKTFCVMRSESRRKWVRKLLLERRHLLVDFELTGEEFDSAIEGVDWDSVGKLALKH